MHSKKNSEIKKKERFGFILSRNSKAAARFSPDLRDKKTVETKKRSKKAKTKQKLIVHSFKI